MMIILSFIDAEWNPLSSTHTTHEIKYRHFIFEGLALINLGHSYTPDDELGTIIGFSVFPMDLHTHIAGV